MNRRNSHSTSIQFRMLITGHIDDEIFVIVHNLRKAYQANFISIAEVYLLVDFLPTFEGAVIPAGALKLAGICLISNQLTPN